MKRLAPAVALLMLSFAAPASAGGSADISVLTSSLSSPTGAYGPWVTEDVSLRLPPSGATGFEIVSRHASNRFYPTTAQYYLFDNYHTWSRGFSTYAGIGAGTGAPFARTRLTFEGDLSAGRGLVAVAGIAFVQTYGSGPLTEASLGTDYYFGDDYLSLRYRPVWSPTLGNSSGYGAALALGHPGRSTHTFRIGGGGENDASLINPSNPSIVGEQTFDAGYSYKHWTSPSSGFHLDLGYGTLSRRGGDRIYARLDTGVGFFFAVK